MAGTRFRLRKGGEQNFQKITIVVFVKRNIARARQQFVECLIILRGKLANLRNKFQRI